MSKQKNKIGIFRDKEDLEVKLTNDNIINITGIMGAGKSTLARKIENEKSIRLISLDWLFGYSIGNRPEYINENLKKIEDIYPETKNQEIFQYFYKRKKDKLVESKYYEYTSKIYQFLIDKYTEPLIIEGRHIYEYMDLHIIKGRLIIKRTSLIHSYKRAFKRDVQTRIKQYKNGEIKIKLVWDKIWQRVKVPIEDYIKINKFIIEVENICKEY